MAATLHFVSFDACCDPISILDDDAHSILSHSATFLCSGGSSEIELQFLIDAKSFRSPSGSVKISGRSMRLLFFADDLFAGGMKW